MNKNNELYSSPTTKILVVRLEGSILTLSTQGNTINNATVDAWDEEL